MAHLLYDDYAHHPVEIVTTLKSAREQFPNRHIVVAFHPHLRSRTEALFDDFAAAFVDADEILLAPIFVAREEPDSEISSEMLAAKIRERGERATAFGSLQEIGKYLIENAHADDLVITMGAGDIYTIMEQLLTA